MTLHFAREVKPLPKTAVGYYEIQSFDGRKLDGGCFNSESDAVRWYDIVSGAGGYLYHKHGGKFYPINTDTNWLDRFNSKN